MKRWLHSLICAFALFPLLSSSQVISHRMPHEDSTNSWKADNTFTTASPATSGMNQSGGHLMFGGNYWNGSASTPDMFSCNDVLGSGTNPTATWTCSHSGTSGTVLALFNFPFSIGNNSFTEGSAVISGNVIVGGTSGTGSVAGDITAARNSTSGAYFLGTDGGQLFRNGNSFQLIGTSITLTFPTSTATLVGRATTDTLTNKTIGAGGLAGLTPTFQKITANGTFTIPTGVTAVKATLIGGGGAGGGSTATANGGGGGSGGIAIKYLSGLTPGNTIAVTVGAGGTGVSTGTGNTGGPSTIASGTQTITTVTANGGSGGQVTGVVSQGGAGAIISTNGDINGAGVSGMPSIAGNIGQAGASTMFGGSGTIASGGGASGNAAVANTGSGGSGNGAGINGSGGAGAAGIVIFEWLK
jgi:hypothetical protein